MPADPPLRALTYLAPGIPLALFAHVVAHLSRALERPIALASEERISGPMSGHTDPFAAGEADLGFLCAPSYLYLRSLPRPSIELVPAGFVFDDPRNGGRPVYFSEVLVRADDPAATLADLAGRAWGYNDRCSLSGYFSTLQALAELGRDEGFFASSRCTGSHARSIEALLDGAIDAAAVDANTWRTLSREEPNRARALRPLATWGPFPIQPVVLRAALGPELRARIAAALLALADDPAAGPAARAHGLSGCAPIASAEYDDERRALVALGQLE